MLAVYGLCALLLASAAAPGGAADQALAHIRERMTANLARLPNYTCTEQIQRRRLHEDGCENCETRDRVRLEVVVVGGRERFAWPGAAQFGDRELTDLVGYGAVMIGDFSGFAKGVFLSDGPVFRAAGENRVGGRRALRYDFEVAASHSGFHLRDNDAEAVVGYRGSLWADPSTWDLVRLEVEPLDIPAAVPVVRTHMTTDYARVPIGGSEFLLPRSTDLTIEARSGLWSRNRTRYVGCREYSAQSAIRFDGEPAEAGRTPGAAPETATESLLPAGLAVRTRLSEALNTDKAAIGDPVVMEVVRPASSGGAVLLDRSARLTGRIVRLEEHIRPRRYILLGLEFDGFSSAAGRYAFHGVLKHSGSPWEEVIESLPGDRGAVFLLTPRYSIIPRNSTFDWVTTSPSMMSR